MEKKQYTITERNQEEGETYGYVMWLTNEEVNVIKRNIIYHTYGETEINPSNLTKEHIQIVNDHSSNAHRDRLGFYEFENETTLNDWSEYGDIFLNGTGLRQIK